MNFLAKEQQKSNEIPKFYYICREKFEMLKMKNYLKVTDHCLYTGEWRGAAHSICILNCNVPKVIPIVIYIGLWLLFIYFKLTNL